MEKRYKLIEISKFYCKNQEVHTTEYHDGYIDYDFICKINNKVCDEEHCNHKQLQLEGHTKEKMIEKIEDAIQYYVEDTKIVAEAALNALLENK